VRDIFVAYSEFLLCESIVNTRGASGQEEWTKKLFYGNTVAYIELKLCETAS